MVVCEKRVVIICCIICGGRLMMWFFFSCLGWFKRFEVFIFDVIFCIFDIWLLNEVVLKILVLFFRWYLDDGNFIIFGWWCLILGW